MRATPFVGRAAAAAALAVLLSACGKDVRVSGGGGGALPTEERLRIFPHKTGSGGPVRPSSRPARLTVSDFARDRASWTTPDDYLGGAHVAYTDLLSVAERAAIPAAGMSAAAVLRPAVAQDSAGYTRPPPYTRVRPDNDAFWQEEATNRGAQEDLSRVEYWANSGVSQSSRGASGKVGDRVHAEVGWSGSNPTFRVGLRHYSAGSLADWLLDSESPNRSASYFARWTKPYGPTHGGRGGAFRTGVPDGGDMTLVVRTDRTGAEDADWLATGMWWTRSTSASPGSFGVFADGGDPVFAGAGDGDPVVEQARLRRLTGKATYTGASHGVFSYADADDRRNVPFQGRATLTADFGDASAYGSVSGSIHDMKSGGPVYIPGDPRITLGGHLSPGLQRRGMFKGGARMTWNRGNYSGKWGGQFFGPSSAAGTFGVAADAGHSFIGTFEVHAPGFSITDAVQRLLESEMSEWAVERSLWTPTAAERAGPHAAYTDLVSVGADRLADPSDIQSAARLAPSFARVSASYTRPAPYTRVRPDGGAFWQESATDSGAPAQRSRVAYWANSGVSQSSRGASGRVGDRVHAEVGWSGSDPTFRVELRDGTSGPLTHWAFDSESPNRPAGYFTRWTAPDGATHGGRGGSFRSGVLPGGGRMWLFVRTDRTGAADTDWLATGMWWASTTSAPYGFFGVFADGGDPFHGNIASLAGTATYTGAAHGSLTYFADDGDGNTETHILFQGSARLAADFGGASAHGSVSGRIDDMRSGDRLIPGGPAITLGEASLDHNASRHLPPGAFTGSASMTYAGENYSGKWGGEFFGNPSAGAAGAGAHPSSAAGSFGVAAGFLHAFVGTFEVHR